MNIYLKSFISLGLSFLILSSVFHIDLHHQDHHEGYNICDINCGNEKHHFISHHCEKCLIKNNELLFQSFVEESLGSQVILFKTQKKWYIKSTIPFNLNCRPPPKVV